VLESRPAERPGIWDRDIETTPTAWKEAGVGMVVTYLTPLNPVPAPLVEETSIEPTAAVQRSVARYKAAPKAALRGNQSYFAPVGLWCMNRWPCSIKDLKQTGSEVI